MSRDSFDRGKEQAQRSARANLLIVIANIHLLDRAKDSEKHRKAANDFNGMIKRNEQFSPGQISYIEGLYEKIWKAAGYDACNLHIDKKRKGLRFG